MQDKLSKHSSQVDLLKELLNLQKDMITMMLSMLEGKILSLFCSISHLLRDQNFFFQFAEGWSINSKESFI